MLQIQHIINYTLKPPYKWLTTSPLDFHRVPTNRRFSLEIHEIGLGQSFPIQFLGDPSPPGILKSTCYIDVRWFPFDVQKCDLKFGSWTYNGWLLDLQILDVDISSYIPNGEWDLVGKRLKECLPGTLWRKWGSLFYSRVSGTVVNTQIESIFIYSAHFIQCALHILCLQ